MAINLIIQNICNADDVPSKSSIRKWAEAAVGDTEKEQELCIRIVDLDESQQLNYEYRNQDKPTNVLSFPFDMEDVEIKLPILGDLVICAEIIRQEAQQQHKNLHAHWAHMVIHGTLHLLGYDHQEEDEAARMENLEINILQKFGYANPYEESNE